MTLENFKQACIIMKEKNQTVYIAATKRNIQGDPERLKAFNEVFGETKSKGSK